MKTLVKVMLMCGACLMLYPLRAQEKPQAKFEFTPYLWYAGLEGDLTVAGRKVDFQKDASDLVDLVDIGGSFRFGVEYDRLHFGALVDALSLSTDELDVEDQPKRGSMDSDLLMVEAAAGYRVDGWAEGQSFLLMIGVRYLELDNDLKLDGAGSFNRKDELTDVMFFLLPRLPVLPSRIEGLYFNPVLGIGAGDSDLAYELFPQFQYEFTETFFARLGYRRVGWKLEEGEKELNVTLAGMMAGIGVNF